jgi:molybdate transport system permease protein
MAMEDLSILGLTVSAALTATALILAPGVALAWGLARSRASHLRDLLETALSLPLVLPPTAVGVLLLALLSPQGFLGSVLYRLGIQLVFTWKAVVIAAATMSFPFLVRSARTAFEEVNPRLLDVARTLGKTRLQVFWRVALPLAWRGVLVGTLLAFSRALGEFGATILIAGNIPGHTQTLSLAIFHRYQVGKDQAALRLVAISTALAFVAIWITEGVSRQRTKRLLT